MQVNKSNLISWAKFLIGWPLSIISVFFIVRYVYNQSSELSISLKDINLVYLIIGVVFFFIYFLLRSYLWRKLITDKEGHISFLENTYKFAFSELKRFTPGNIWSFLSRGALFSEAGFSKRAVGVSIIADIQLVIIGCGIVSLLAVPWIINSRDLQGQLSALVPFSILLIIIYFVATGIVFKKRYDKEGSILSNLFLPGFGLNSKIKVSGVSIVTYFAYGVGNFFILVSLIPIGMGSLITLSAFFTFALLVGYLTFITPMGLGVRELVVSLGLAQVMSSADAGAVSIFTRIILIISELSFLALIFLWQKSIKTK